MSADESRMPAIPGRRWLAGVIGGLGVVLAGAILALAAWYDLLLFYILLPLFSVTCAAGLIFLSLRPRAAGPAPVVDAAGVAAFATVFTAVAFVSAHVGIPLFSGSDSVDRAVQWWLAGRSCEALLFISIPFLLRARRDIAGVLAGVVPALCVMLTLLFVARTLPALFREDAGITLLGASIAFLQSIAFLIPPLMLLCRPPPGYRRAGILPLVAAGVGMSASGMALIAGNYAAFGVPPVTGVLWLAGFLLLSYFVVREAGRSSVCPAPERAADEPPAVRGPAIVAATDTEKVLQESQELLDLALETAQLGAWGINLNTGRVWLSRRFGKMFGYSSVPFEWDKAVLMDTIVPDDRLLVEETLRRARDEGAAFDVVCRIRRADGVVRWIHARATPRLTAPVTTAQIVGFIKDITEERSKEDRIRERAHLLKLAPIFVWTDSAGILFWSRALENIYGYTREEALGQNSHKLLRAAYPLPAEEIMAALKHDGHWTGEVTHTRKDGGQIIVKIHCVLTSGYEGHTPAVIEAVNDITDMKKAEEILERDKTTFEEIVRDRTRELLRAELELENARRLSDIGALSATVAHELRNPLGVIRTAVYNIRRKSQNPLLESHISNIEKKVLESDHIINNLLGYSRIKMPQAEKVKLFVILDECIGFAAERYEGKHIEIKKTIESMNEVIVAVDPFQIREVFNNILDNACQAVSSPGGTLSVSADTSRPDIVSIRFKDNGPGIAAEDMEKIFEPFFTKKSKGTGLGLTVCREMLHLNGGEIVVASKVSKGTTFTITLPRGG